MTREERDAPTQFIPPVPLTPAEGVPDPRHRYQTQPARPYLDPTQGQPPARRRHSRPDEDRPVSVWLALGILLFVGSLAVSAWYFTDQYFDGRIEQQRRFAVTYQMDWTLARTDDESLINICQRLRDPAARGGVLDDFFINISRNFPSAELPRREDIQAYLTRACVDDIWEARRTP